MKYDQSCNYLQVCPVVVSTIFIFQIKSLFFDISGTLPNITTAPSVFVKEDGFSYITGCIYTLKEDERVDLARLAYLVINNKTKIKINGRSTKINPTTFQLPESRFIIPGKYQCLIEAPRISNESVPLSPASSEIPMPGNNVVAKSC